MHPNTSRAFERAAAFANRHGCKLTKAEAFLTRYGRRRAQVLTFGIETVSVGDRRLRYVNTGDTYRQTVAREGRGEVIVTSWGDWYESAESDYEEETDTINCAYCGEFTPLCDAALAQPGGARPAWIETVCESCGHHVDGSD